MLGGMRRLILGATTLALAIPSGVGGVTGVGGVSGAAAHDGAAAYVLVSSDFILPGQPFEVMVSDIGQEARVDFTIIKESRSELLGSTRAAPDGHLMTDLVVPADFPGGYAQLFATVPDVVSASTWVYVGERTGATPPPPAATAAAPWWTDPSVIVLAVLLVGAIGFAGYMILRPKRMESQQVAAPIGSRRSSGKRARR